MTFAESRYFFSVISWHLLKYVLWVLQHWLYLRLRNKSKTTEEANVPNVKGCLTTSSRARTLAIKIVKNWQNFDLNMHLSDQRLSKQFWSWNWPCKVLQNFYFRDVSLRFSSCGIKEKAEAENKEKPDYMAKYLINWAEEPLREPFQLIYRHLQVKRIADGKSNHQPLLEKNNFKTQTLRCFLLLLASVKQTKKHFL